MERTASGGTVTEAATAAPIEDPDAEGMATSAEFK